VSRAGVNSLFLFGSSVRHRTLPAKVPEDILLRNISTKLFCFNTCIFGYCRMLIR
jgi:hypothetical protein